MPRPRNSLSSYLRHKPSGQAITVVRTSDGGRKQFVLGRYGSAESKAEHRRILAVLIDNNGVYPVDGEMTVAEAWSSTSAKPRAITAPGQAWTTSNAGRLLKRISPAYSC